MDFSDTQSLVACRHCNELLQDGDRFCRFCGEIQWEGADATFVDVTVPAEREPMMPMARRSALAIGAPTRSFLATAGARHPNDRSAPPTDVPEWSRPPRTTSPVMLAVAALLVLLFGVMLVHDLYTERKRDAERLNQLGVKLDQMQRALDQGELGAVESTLKTIGDDSTSDPRIQALKEALERQRETQQGSGEGAQASASPPESPPVSAPPPVQTLIPTPAAAQALTPPPAQSPAATVAPAAAAAAAAPVQPPAIQPEVSQVPAVSKPEPKPDPKIEPAPVAKAVEEPAKPSSSSTTPSQPQAAPSPTTAQTSTDSSAPTSSSATADEAPSTPRPGCSAALAAMALCTQP